ncbi:MAG: threonine/serine dehydratase [Spirochaetaceae bacterium]
MQWSDLSLADVLEAAKRIAPVVRRTPLAESGALADSSGARTVRLKLESLQNTGAFKVRGAANRILSLGEEERRRGVITFSTGNHGKAVAYVAGQTGIPAIVCVSEHVAAYRVEQIRRLGAEVVVKGRSQDEAEIEYERLRSERGMTPVVPFDDPYVVAGQATIALEMLTEEPTLDTFVVPLSGGGLLAGVALAAKLLEPTARVVGVSIARSPAMLESLKAGRPVEVEENDTLADSLLGGIGAENRFTLPLVREYVDEHVVVDEADIARGMYYTFTEHSLVAEGAAVVGIAAVLSEKIDVNGRHVGIVVSGSSVDPARYVRVIQDFL